MSTLNCIMHNNTFFRIWDIRDTLGDVKVIEFSIYEKLSLEIAELQAKLAFMTASAQQNAQERNDAEKLLNKYMNYYSAEAVTTRLQSDMIEKLQAGTFELWSVNSAELLECIKYYEANTGLKAKDIIKDNPNGYFKLIKD